MVVDQKGLLSSLGNSGPVLLDLGCGPSKRLPDHIGVDTISYACVDLVGDVFDVLFLLPDESVDGIYTSHFLEHIADLPKLLGEIERVLKPGALIKVVVPHFSNAYFYSDPTHKITFGLYTFCYFAESNLFSRKVPHYGRSPKLTLSKVKLNFKSDRPFYFRYAFKRAVGLLVNISTYTQEFYEDLFTGIVSCYEIEFTLRKHG